MKLLHDENEDHSLIFVYCDENNPMQLVIIQLWYLPRQLDSIEAIPLPICCDHIEYHNVYENILKPDIIEYNFDL